MEFFRDYMKEIAGFTVISGLLVNLLPDNKNVKYVKLFTGLVLTLLLISPLLNLRKIEIEDIFTAEAGVQVSTEKLQQQMNENLEKEYEKICSQYLTEIAGNYGVLVEHTSIHGDEISVYVHDEEREKGAIQIEKIILTEDAADDKYQEFAENIAEKLNIKTEQVHIYETG